MRGFVRFAAGSLALVGCAGLAGLDGYSSGPAECEGGGCAHGADGSSDGEVGAPEGGAVDAARPADATAVDAPTGSGTPDASTIDEGAWTCPQGGCNASRGACTGPTGCFCTADSQCKSGKCVVAAGSNDVSCGSSCSGSGPVDGFQCALQSPGIPASCVLSGFGYTPENLGASQLAGLTPVAAVDLSCSGTLAFNGSTWTGATCGQTLPSLRTVTQTGGPSLAVLAFDALAVGSGITITLTGSSPVVIVVFGDAAVAGTIHADGASGTANSNTPGASGPGGDSSCGGSPGGTGNASHTSGGGGAQTAGGAGADGVGGTGGRRGDRVLIKRDRPAARRMSWRSQRKLGLHHLGRWRRRRAADLRCRQALDHRDAHRQRRQRRDQQLQQRGMRAGPQSHVRRRRRGRGLWGYDRLAGSERDGDRYHHRKRWVGW
jgi:hypothetical protein